MNELPNLKLSFSSIVLLVEELETIFGRVFLLYSSNNHNLKDKSGKGKGKKTRKRREGKRDIPRSFIRKEKLPGAEASWDGWQEVGQGTTCTREAAKRRRTETNEGSKRKKEKKEEVVRGEGYASPWAMQPERRIIRIYLCTHKTVLVSPRRSRIV